MVKKIAGEAYAHGHFIVDSNMSFMHLFGVRFSLLFFVTKPNKAYQIRDDQAMACSVGIN
jgi:hypothetical protein